MVDARAGASRRTWKAAGATRWRPATRAEALFRDRCTGVAWELDTAHAYSLWSLSHLGEWAELARAVRSSSTRPANAATSTRSMNLSTYVLSIVRLAADEPAEAREEPAPCWAAGRGTGYHVQHNDLIWALVQIDLYRGRRPRRPGSAWNRHWPTLARSLLLRVQFIRVAMLGLRAPRAWPPRPTSPRCSGTRGTTPTASTASDTPGPTPRRR